MIKKIIYQVSWCSNNDVQNLILLFFPQVTIMSITEYQLKMNRVKVKAKETHSMPKTSHRGCWLKLNKRQGITWRSAFIYHCFSSSIHKTKPDYVNSSLGLNKTGKYTKHVSVLFFPPNRTPVIWNRNTTSLGVIKILLKIKYLFTV